MMYGREQNEDAGQLLKKRRDRPERKDFSSAERSGKKNDARGKKSPQAAAASDENAVKKQAAAKAEDAAAKAEGAADSAAAERS